MAHLTSAEAADLLERFRNYLREHRLPVTQQRDLVADAVFTSPDHLTAAAVHQRLARQGKQVGIATVYRTLDLLVEGGLVREHDFGDGYRRFEPAPIAHLLDGEPGDEPQVRRDQGEHAGR